MRERIQPQDNPNWVKPRLEQNMDANLISVCKMSVSNFIANPCQPQIWVILWLKGKICYAFGMVIRLGNWGLSWKDPFWGLLKKNKAKIKEHKLLTSKTTSANIQHWLRKRAKSIKSWRGSLCPSQTGPFGGSFATNSEAPFMLFLQELILKKSVDLGLRRWWEARHRISRLWIV